MRECPICKEMVWEAFDGTLLHECSPEFEVLDNDNTGENWEDAYVVRANDFEQAAKKAADEMDSSNGAGAFERTLHVRKKGESEVKIFHISFDYEVIYYATESMENAG